MNDKIKRERWKVMINDFSLLVTNNSSSKKLDKLDYVQAEGKF